MRTILLIILEFLIQFAYSSKYIKFLMRGATNQCDDSGNYIFDLLIKDYEGVDSFNIILKEPSYATATCVIEGDEVDFYASCKINGETYPLELTKVELPKELSGIDFEYSGWENISSYPVLDDAATCNYDEFHLSNFYLEPKDQVVYSDISKEEHEFKIPGLFIPAMSMDSTLPSYKINVNYRYDNSKIGLAEDCILSITDKVNITHSKSELKCKTKGEKTVQFFPTIASNIENEIKVYIHISKIFSLDDYSSFLCHKVLLLSVFLFFVLF